jgi:TatD DNase family protein
MVMRRVLTVNRNLPLIDVHAHLNELEELEKDLREARRQGISAIIGVGMCLESNRRILAIAKENPTLVFPAIGYHPWKIKKPEIRENLAFIKENVKHCVAIGEVGLDYKAKVKKQLQRDVFQEIVKLSIRYHKTLILHCRYSHERVFSMISDMGVKKAIFHWYSGSLDLLQKIIDSGHYISATPALRYSPQHQEAVKEAALERILLETDCPVSYQGHVSKPSDVRITLREVAKIKGLSLKTVAERTSQNAIGLLGPFDRGLNH